VAILWFYKSQRRSHRGEGTKEKHTERKALTGEKKGEENRKRTNRKHRDGGTQKNTWRKRN
jgi:hypothetical protein